MEESDETQLDPEDTGSPLGHAPGLLRPLRALGGEPAASGKNGVNTQLRVVLQGGASWLGPLPLQEHLHIHALNPKLDPLVPEPRPLPQPPARAAACGPASPSDLPHCASNSPPKSLPYILSLTPRVSSPVTWGNQGFGALDSFLSEGPSASQMGPKTLELESHAEP